MKKRGRQADPVTRRQGTRSLACALSMLSCLLMGGCAGVQSALDPAGPQAARISGLWWFMFWLSAVVFVAVLGATLLAVWRGRAQRPADEAEAMRPELQPEPERERRMTSVILVAGGLTIVALFTILVLDFVTGRALTSLSAAPRIAIDMTGKQWWWDVRYADPSPSQIATLANEIHIPVGVPVQIKLRSNDVIHSFWVPNLHGKKDMIPGYLNVTWLQADRPGLYRGQCAEFCGHQHAHMAFTVVAEPFEQFNAWLENQRRPAIPPATPEQQRGQQVFLTSPCVMCHTIRGTPAGSRYGPDLTHVASRQAIAAGRLANVRDHLAKWITNSQEIKPGNRMPPVPLNNDDLQALLSYLESLK